MVDKRCVINPVKKVFDEAGKTAFIKRAFKGVFNNRLCLLFIYILFIGACPRIVFYVISTNSAVVAIGYYPAFAAASAEYAGEVCREKSKTDVFSIQ